MTTASLGTDTQPPARQDAAPGGSLLREGAIVGILGAAAVAIWFVILDAARGQVLFTPAALGSALFLGADSPAAAQVTPGMIAAFTLVHTGAFILIGIAATAIVRGIRQHPPLVLGAILLFVTLETFFIGLIAITATWLVDALTWWSIAFANLLAAVVMGGYLWRAHPEVQAVLRRGDLEADQPDPAVERVAVPDRN